jgi:hypothetical protein
MLWLFSWWGSSAGKSFSEENPIYACLYVWCLSDRHSGCYFFAEERRVSDSIVCADDKFRNWSELNGAE